ncbi:hypothetical protein HPB48_002496 [Haemaphysalis longicornis]|uniref:Uncharacterized protein n=1 Tax=Haemaphysalis longicornis TaxID=44386 RepID=A0A9J6G5Q0_HAELO|nr:hypothetical protein HPB48_002496 [Haemaphysalis longicornis]
MKHTKTNTIQKGGPCVDKRPGHCWEARNALIKWWKKCRTNRKLKERIAKLNQHIQQYSDTLRRQQWKMMCEKIQGTLNISKTCRILKALIDPEATKTPRP